MENRAVTDAHIREYLLGRLDADSEMIEQIEEQVVTDPTFSINVDVIEDEIIEEYIEGLLNSDDLRAVEGHFLRPPERQEKLRNAKLLGHLATISASNEVNQASAAMRVFSATQPRTQVTHLRIYAEIAAMVILAVSLGYLIKQRRDLEVLVKQDRLQLADERKRFASLDKQLQAVLQTSQSSTVTLNLFEPGLRRSISDFPELKVSPATRTLHVEVALPFETGGKYQIQLEREGKAVWSRINIDASIVAGGAILILDVPAEVVSEGAYELAVQGTRERKSYWFLVTKIRSR